MPKKTTAKENAAVAPVRAAKPKTTRTVPVVEVAARPRVTRVKSVTHSKAAAPAVTEVSVAVNANEQIAKIAFGYWEARGFQHGSDEQDWLRAEQEYLQSV